MHRTESSLQLRMFSGRPAESVWSSVSEMCRGSPRGKTSAVPGLGISKMPFLPVWFLGGFLALAAEPQQMANWTSTTRPSGAILMPHMLHPAAMTSWRLLSHSPSQPSPWLHNPNCWEETSACTNTHIHTRIKTSWSSESPHARHSKATVGYYFISLTHTGNAKECGNCHHFLLIFLNIQISHVMKLNCWY